MLVRVFPPSLASPCAAACARSASGAGRERRSSKTETSSCARGDASLGRLDSHRTAHHIPEHVGRAEAHLHVQHLRALPRVLPGLRAACGRVGTTGMAPHLGQRARPKGAKAEAKARAMTEAVSYTHLR